MSDFEDDFADLFDDWMTKNVSVKKFTGTGFDGAIFDAPVVVEKVMIEDARKLVRASDGNQKVSETTIYVHAEDASKITLHSLVQLPDRESTVLRIASPEVYGLFSFIVVNLE